MPDFCEYASKLHDIEVWWRWRCVFWDAEISSQKNSKFLRQFRYNHSRDPKSTHFSRILAVYRNCLEISSFSDSKFRRSKIHIFISIILRYHAIWMHIHKNQAFFAPTVNLEKNAEISIFRKNTSKKRKFLKNRDVVGKPQSSVGHILTNPVSGK